MTPRELIARINELPQEQHEWQLRLCCDYGDLVISGRVEAVRTDGFHEHVNLVGPVVKDQTQVTMQVRNLTASCQKAQICRVRGGYMVQQCNKLPGHDKRHSYSNASPILDTMDEAVHWMKENGYA